MWKWINGGYPIWFMEDVVGYYNIDQHVKLQQQDAVSAAQEKAAKRAAAKGRKR